MSLDPCWKLEHSFLKDMLGDAGFEKLQADFMKNLPSKNVEQDLAAAVQGVRLVLAAQLFKFVPKENQGQLNAAYELLARMQQGFAPIMPKAPCTFLKDVWARLPLFARTTRATNGGKKVTLTGAEAARHMLTELTQMEGDKMTFEHIENLSIFAFLLKKEEQETLQGFMDQVSKRAGKVYTKGKSKSSSSMPAASSSDEPSRKRKRIATDEVDAAASMFR